MNKNGPLITTDNFLQTLIPLKQIRVSSTVLAKSCTFRTSFSLEGEINVPQKPILSPPEN